MILNQFWNGLKEIIGNVILHILKNIKIVFLAVLLTKWCEVMIHLASLCSLQRKNAVYKSIEEILKEYDSCKKNDKKAF